VDWIGLAKDRNRWRALVNSVLNLRVPWNAGKLSSGLTSSGLSISVQLHVVSYLWRHLAVCVSVYPLILAINPMRSLHVLCLYSLILVGRLMISNLWCKHGFSRYNEWLQDGRTSSSGVAWHFSLHDFQTASVTPLDSCPMGAAGYFTHFQLVLRLR
jgi:hypothetical protein